MRPTIRPFKIEFKNRFSRSTPMHSTTIDDAGKARTTAGFLDVGVFTADRRSDANGCGDARKAADTLFSRSVPAAPAPETVSQSNAPVGRVLPSLTENSGALADGFAEADEQSRRSRIARKTRAAASPRSKNLVVQRESVMVLDSDERAVMEIPLEASIAAAPDHERRSIHKRCLLDADLKAGERWKRRLCRAAR
jgi:hypothetical protein